MLKIRVAIVGVGNCASSLVQGLEFYRRQGNRDLGGLMHPSIGGYGCDDIEVVAAFDIDRRKVGLPVEQAIFGDQPALRIARSLTVAPSTDWPDRLVEAMMTGTLEEVADRS